MQFSTPGATPWAAMVANTVENQIVFKICCYSFRGALNWVETEERAN
jgi:hypothetical protein